MSSLSRSTQIIPQVLRSKLFLGLQGKHVNT